MLAHAITNAIDYLLTARSPDGFWRDFWTPSGISDAWVTGYVAAVLAASPAPKAYTVALEAWSLLECDRFNDEGWGYGPGVPVDSDSTAWILLLAERLGRGDSERAHRARNVVKRYMVAGGISTFGQNQVNDLRHYVQLPAEFDLSAWCYLPHTCVTAAVAGLSQFRPSLTDYLLDTQQDSGNWTCYWWFEPAYATALAANALATAGGSRASIAVEQAIAWARSRMHASLRTTHPWPLADAIDVPPHGWRPQMRRSEAIPTLESSKTPTPFELAWLLRILLLDNNLSTDAQQCLDLLLSLQEPNGSWRGTARLRVPRPDESHPDSIERWTRWFGPTGKFKTLEDRFRHIFTIFSLDQRAIFTTATALAALQEISNAYQHIV